MHLASVLHGLDSAVDALGVVQSAKALARGVGVALSGLQNPNAPKVEIRTLRVVIVKNDGPLRPSPVRVAEPNRRGQG